MNYDESLAESAPSYRDGIGEHEKTDTSLEEIGNF